MFDRLRRYFLVPAGASVALEFSSAAIVAGRVEKRRGSLELRALASEALSPGSFSPSLEDPGFVRREEIRDAIKRVLARIDAPSGIRAALVVPDILARFRLFPADEVKEEPKKREALVAFKMQKLLPFPVAEARVVSAWPRVATDPVLALGFSASVLSAYEQVGQAFGLDVGSVETSSMALLRGVSHDGDALLVRHDPAFVTLSLTRNGWPLSIRSFDATVARSSDEVRREIASTSVFWRDRHEGEQLKAAVIHASDPWFESLGRDIQEVFGCSSQRAAAPRSLVVAGVPQAIERSAAPALALLGAY